jgi:hypothetical protein
VAQWLVEQQSNHNGQWDGNGKNGNNNSKIVDGGSGNNYNDNNNDSKCGGQDGHHWMRKGR